MQKPEPFDEVVWGESKEAVMREAVRSKFQAAGASGESLRGLLLSTHPHPLLGIKGDTFWGFNSGGGGDNILGVLLVQFCEEVVGGFGGGQQTTAAEAAPAAEHQEEPGPVTQRAVLFTI